MMSATQTVLTDAERLATLAGDERTAADVLASYVAPASFAMARRRLAEAVADLAAVPATRPDVRRTLALAGDALAEADNALTVYRESTAMAHAAMARWADDTLAVAAWLVGRAYRADERDTARNACAEVLADLGMARRYVAPVAYAASDPARMLADSFASIRDGATLAVADAVAFVDRAEVTR